MRIVTWISNVMVAIGAIAVGIMMFLSVADIAGRDIFLRPIKGTYELVGMLLVIASCLSLGHCQLVKGNIKIDVITSRLSNKWQAILDCFSFLMSIVVAALFTWRARLMMYEHMTRTPPYTTDILGLQDWPFVLIMAIGFAWVTVIFIIDLHNAVTRVWKR